MSLLDTIKAARQEAEEAGTIPNASKRADAQEGDAKASDKQRSATRRSSAASAKPTRELAGSVRTAGDSSKSKEKMTSEERRAARNERRHEEDVIYDAKKVVLESMPEYKRTQRVWWAMLIAGIVLTIVAWGAMRSVGGDTAGDENIAMLSVVLMVMAYVLVIGAFIYDLVRVRPLRKKADEKLMGMSKRRMIKLVEEEERRKAEEKAKK